VLASRRRCPSRSYHLKAAVGSPGVIPVLTTMPGAPQWVHRCPTRLHCQLTPPATPLGPCKAARAPPIPDPGRELTGAGTAVSAGAGRRRALPPEPHRPELRPKPRRPWPLAPPHALPRPRLRRTSPDFAHPRWPPPPRGDIARWGLFPRG
jgi:hypothetical protein